MKKRQQKKNLKKLIKVFGEMGNIADEMVKAITRMSEEIGEILGGIQWGRGRQK